MEEMPVIESSDNISILSFEKEDGKRVYNFNENELDIEVEDKDYIFITDEGERDIREAIRPHPNSDSPSGVYINTPKNFTWATIGTGIVFIGTILFNLFSIYDKQTKFNERTEETLVRHREEISYMRQTVATKVEEDLKFQNVDSQIKRLEQLIVLAQKDIERMEHRK